MVRPNELIAALADEGVAFVVLGGLAAVAHGSAYVTDALDICYARVKPNYQRLAHALAPFQPGLRDPMTDAPFVLDAATLERGENFLLRTTAGDLDLLAQVTGLGRYDKVWRASEGMELRALRRKP
ncbi:MAG: hypothetical protein EXR72_02490 [Myxococcales bacterium]|nr:hypothetical protein [Myxococcales bacterium]